MRLEKGQKAPDFELAGPDGEPVSLSAFRGKRSVVLFFYPKDESLVCTKEACSFRDRYEDFKDLGAEVIGISSDPIEAHRGFASKHQLPFLLLSDSGGEVRKRYGVPATLGILPGRVTFVIDKRGVVQHSFSSQLRAGKHVEEALAILRSLDEEDA